MAGHCADPGELLAQRTELAADGGDALLQTVFEGATAAAVLLAQYGQGQEGIAQARAARFERLGIGAGQRSRQRLHGGFGLLQGIGQLHGKRKRKSRSRRVRRGG
ncbi:hypothetical protein D3C80_1804330 [compost metagenome]